MSRGAARAAWGVDVPQLKGSILRGYAKWADRHAVRAAIDARVPEASRRALADPPLPTQWIDVSISVPILDAIADVTDVETVRRCQRESTNEGLFATLQPVLRGLLRVFGATPASVFSRLELVMRESARGYEYAWEPGSASEGTVVIRTLEFEETRASAEAWAGGLESVFDVCGTSGRAEVESRTRNGKDSIVRIRLRWQPR